MNQPKHVLFFGRPGCGKDTHGDVQAGALGMQHFVMSSILRPYLESLETPESRKELAAMDAGGMVSKPFADAAFAQYATLAKNKDTIWNGFPRTVDQKAELEKYIPHYSVVYIEITRREAMARIEGRAKADLAAGKRVRADDAEHAKRLDRQEKFETLTLPILAEFHKSKKNVVVVDGMGSKAETSAQIAKAMEEIMGTTKAKVDGLLVA